MSYKNLMESQKIKGLHFCGGNTKYISNGPAINYCYEEKNGKLVVENDEYDSEINYCPYCGYKAKIEAEKYL